MDNVQTLTTVAKMILDENPNASLTGTLMLKLRGIDLGRQPADIDILICDYALNITFPPNMDVELIGVGSGDSAKYKYNEIIIDVLSDGEEPELVDGIRMGTVQCLMNNKYKYSLQENEHSKKHHEDLIKLGFEFPY